MPAYDIVKIRSRVRRSLGDQDHTRSVHLRAFNKDHALNLQRNDRLIRGGQLPLYFADHDQHGSVVVSQSTSDEVSTINFVALAILFYK